MSIGVDGQLRSYVHLAQSVTSDLSIDKHYERDMKARSSSMISCNACLYGILPLQLDTQCREADR